MQNRNYLWLDRSPLIDGLIESLEHTGNPWAPYPLSQFLDGLSFIHTQRPNCRFLEIGSGTGSKLYLAQRAGFDAAGIENQIECLIDGLNIINVDAREFNGYNKYDCIYHGGILTELQAQEELENRIISQVQPSAFLFWPLSHVPIRHGWHEIYRGVWVL